MTPKPFVTEQDAERPTVDLLKAYLGNVTVGTDLPAGWTVDSGTFVQVSSDGSLTNDWPIRTVSVVRVTVWSAVKSSGLDIARRCQGKLMASRGFRDASGIIATRDSITKARLASFTINLSQYTKKQEGP